MSRELTISGEDANMLIQNGSVSSDRIGKNNVSILSWVFPSNSIHVCVSPLHVPMTRN